MPRQLRELFAYICVFAVPGNAAHLFERYKQSLFEDFARHTRQNDDCPCCESLALIDIQSTLILHGEKCEDFGLPTPPSHFVANLAHQYDDFLEKQPGETMLSTLNDEQNMAFETIMEAINNDDMPHRCFFLDGPGCASKTYLYKTFLSTLRSAKKIALPVASTGIAANLLDGGRTYHSQFKLPVPLLETSVDE